MKDRAIDKFSRFMALITDAVRARNEGPVKDRAFDEFYRFSGLITNEGADALRNALRDTPPLDAAQNQPFGLMLDRLLIEAAGAGSGSEEHCRVLLDAGADVNGMSLGYSPLLSAIEGDRIAMVRFLLDQGADLHARGVNGYDAIGKATVNASPDLIEFLIERGADVNTRTDVDGGWTPLMDAANFNRPDVARLLLEHGADRSIGHGFGGDTAEDLARQCGHTEVANIIRDWGS